MEFKRGLYIIDEGLCNPRYFYGHALARNLLNANPKAFIIGYSRFGDNGAPNADYYFRDDKGCIAFTDLSEAEEYVYLRGWDDDNTATLGNYSVIYSRVSLKMVTQAAISWNEGLKEAVDRALGREEKPKCDCGGVKCNLPCMDWCSLKRTNNKESS